MRNTTPRAALRRAAGSLAAVGLLAAGSLAPAGTAHAAGTAVLHFGGPAETALHPYPASGAPQRTSVAITIDNPYPDVEHGGFEGEYTVTFDLSGIAGVADAVFGKQGAADCAITGTTGVCHGEGLSPGTNPLPELRVTAAQGSEDGDWGTIRITGAADGETFEPFSTRIGVGGPDLIMKQSPLKTELKPGETQPVPLVFSNNGTRAADGILLTLMYTHGIEFTERYQNCEYKGGDATRGVPVWTTALCSVKGSFEAGATYELAEPLTLRATGRAYRDSFVYRVDEGGSGAFDAQRAGARFAPGAKGNVLSLKELPTARSADLNPRDNQQEADFSTANTADFVADGDTARGVRGGRAEANIGFHNEGPAWIAHLRSGESVATLDFTVPEGASVVEWPDNCRGVTADGRYRKEQSGAPRYLCEAATAFGEDQYLALHFDMKIAKVVVGASGAVVVRSARLNDPLLPFDPKRKNNTASFVLNADDPGDFATGGAGATASGSTDGSTTTGGTAGGSAGGSTGDGGATSGGAGATGATGATGSAGSTGSTGSASGTGGTGGGLAATGSTALPAATAAAAALLAGGVLYVTTRRRAVRQR
ncbi:peptidase [Streptomyces brevispora]|uniref:peptidase n=1 Tax=Streptomyces brevispora TaxID=887462 RepID=UPI0035DDFAC9